MYLPQNHGLTFDAAFFLHRGAPGRSVTVLLGGGILSWGAMMFGGRAQDFSVLRCSFCHKSQGSAEKLVASPSDLPAPTFATLVSRCVRQFLTKPRGLACRRLFREPNPTSPTPPQSSVRAITPQLSNAELERNRWALMQWRPLLKFEP